MVLLSVLHKDDNNLITQITARNVLKSRLCVEHGERGSGTNFHQYLSTSAQMGSYLVADRCCANVVILTLVRTLLYYRYTYYRLTGTIPVTTRDALDRYKTVLDGQKVLVFS